MSPPIFICYSSADREFATEACAALESCELRCWIAPRDVLGGAEYMEQLDNALSDCRMVVLVFSRSANDSPHVRREIERAVSYRKIILPVRVENVLPAGSLRFALSNTHWLDAITRPAASHFPELCTTTRKLLQKQAVRALPDVKATSSIDLATPSSPKYSRALSRRLRLPWWSWMTILIAITMGGGGAYKLRRAQQYETREPVLDKQSIIQPLIESVMNAQSESGGFRIGQSLGSDQQVWTSAQVIVSISQYPSSSSVYRDQLRQAFVFIEKKRRITPESGWGYFSSESHTITEIGAWVSVAYVKSLESGAVWRGAEVPEVVAKVRRNLKEMCERQIHGGWSPIDDTDQNISRTYSTVMAVWALTEARGLESTKQMSGEFDRNLRDGVSWLLDSYDARLGWLPNPNRRNQDESFPGLTAQAFYVLARLSRQPGYQWINNDQRFRAASELVLDAPIVGAITDVDRLAPIDQTLSPVHLPGSSESEFRMETSSFLRQPWILASSSMIRSGQSTDIQKRRAEGIIRSLLDKCSKSREDVSAREVFKVAEVLLSLGTLDPQAEAR